MAARLKFGFIPFPLAIVDESADLSLGEYRLLGYLLRHHFRVKSAVFRMSQDALLKGVLAADGATRRDKGCGLTSGRDIKTAREKLVSRGWLAVTDAPDGMLYELTLEEDEEGAGNREQGTGIMGQGLGVKSDMEASAECTEVEDHPQSAQCPDGQCAVSDLPVQSALGVIRKEKVKKVEEGRPPRAALAETEIDPRWNDIRSDLKLYWEFKNPGVPMPWDGPVDGKALKIFLKSNPQVQRDLWLVCLRNRAKSDVAHADQMHRWIRELLRYSEGPRDRFDKVIQGKGGRKHDEQQQVIDSNRANLTEWAAGPKAGASSAVSGRGRPVLGPGGDQGDG